MKKAITLLTLTIFLFVFANNSQLNSFEPSSDLTIQTVKTQTKPGHDLIDGYNKLTSDKNLKSGLHTIFKSASGTMYCVKLKNGKVDKLIVTSSEGNQIKPKIIKGSGKNNQCTVCATISKKPLIEECWEWFCN
ncbi:MAG: hypothetical protein FIA82_12515 [Melioribacter sp.]|nr:hypothetical protein [Melioribacter sp.]